MNELVLSGNMIAKLMLQALAPTLPGAHIGQSNIGPHMTPLLTALRPGLFDSHGLFQDILDYPSLYLNGTAPLNTTGVINSCVFQINGTTGVCSTVEGSARDSYLW